MKKWGHLQNWSSNLNGKNSNKVKTNLSVDQRAASIQRMMNNWDGTKLEGANILIGAPQGPPPSPSQTPTNTPTPSVTPTFTPTASITPTITPTQSSTTTPTPTISSTLTPTPTPTPVFYYILAEDSDILEAENGDFLEKEQLT